MNGEELAVQGVIDLILITRDGKIKLYDYKTDNVKQKLSLADKNAIRKYAEGK